MNSIKLCEYSFTIVAFQINRGSPERPTKRAKRHPNPGPSMYLHLSSQAFACRHMQVSDFVERGGMDVVSPPDDVEIVINPVGMAGGCVPP